MTDTTTLSHTPEPGTFRFLHTSDWQLGMDRWFLGEEASPRYREARLRVIETLLEIAQERGCAAVVVAGDVFDDNLVDRVTWRRAVDILRGSPVPVFLLPGNHDPYDAASVYRSPEFRALAPTVQVLSDSTPHRVTGEQGPDADIVGAPLLSKYMSVDPVATVLAELRAEDSAEDSAEGNTEDNGEKARAAVRVVVGHGATESRESGADPSIIDVDGAAQACAESVVDVVALGDTHSVVNLHPSGTVWYSGSPEVTDFREQHGGGEHRSGFVLITDVTPAEAGPSTVEVEEVATGQWRFLALAAEITGPEDLDTWLYRLEGLPDKRTTVVKYALSGSVDLATSARLDEEMERLVPSFAALYPRERLMDLHVIPGDEELAGADWPGVIGVAATELSEAAAEGDAASRDALRLLYRLSPTTAVATGQGSSPTMLKITSLTLDHVAGVTHATVTVPEKGVMVVHGPNERGKSTVLKALRLLLSDTLFSSGKREVRELKDVSADEPPTITAELTVGEHELRITKAYKQGSGRCELTVTAPRTENLTGREASDRFAEILAQEVDADLLDALTIEQGKSMEMLVAAGLGPLEQALVAAPGADGDQDSPRSGEAGAVSSVASVSSAASAADTTSLIDRIEKERKRYFTPTGRPTGELDAAQKAVTAARAEYDEADVRYGQAQGLIEELGRLRADRDDIMRQQPEAEASAEKAEAELTAGREVHAVLERHRAAVAQATDVLEVAEQRQQVRSEKSAELDVATEAVTTAAQQVEEATEAATLEKQQESEVRAKWEQARRTTAVATAYVNYLAAVRDNVRVRQSCEDLATQQKAAAEISERLGAAETTVSENPVTLDTVAELHRLAADRRRADGVRDAAATTVQISGPGGGRITVDGETTELDTDGLTVGVTARREFGVGDYRVSVTPALDLKDIDDDVARAQAALARALADLGVGSIEDAETLAESRRVAVETVTELRLELGTATGGLSVTELEAKAQQLETEVVDTAASIDAARESVLAADPDSTVDEQLLPGLGALRAGGTGADAVADGDSNADADTVDLAKVRRVVVDSDKQADRLREDLDNIVKAGAVFRLASREADLERETERRERLDKALTQARSEISDEDLQQAVDTARTSLDTARTALQDAIAELGEGAGGESGLVDLKVLEGLAAGATTRVERLRERAEAIGHEISRANGALGEHAGVAERREEASTNLERVSRQLRSVQERATAADLLYTTVEAARADARQRYEAPFRASFEKLARTLYGRWVEFEFNEDLTVARRILDGTSLATSQLSGGAQEQIAVLSRLAVADIIGGGEAVPIVIDDALGFSDAGRAQRMNLVLAQLAAYHQIIVLTCDPSRFDSVPGAFAVSMDSLRAAA